MTSAPLTAAIRRRALARRLGESLADLLLPSLALDADTDLTLTSRAWGLPLAPFGTRGLAQVLAAPQTRWGHNAEALARGGVPALQATASQGRTAFLASLGLLPEAPMGDRLFLVGTGTQADLRLADLPGRLDLPGATTAEVMVEAARHLGGVEVPLEAWPALEDPWDALVLVAPADPLTCKHLAQRLGLTWREAGRITGGGALTLLGPGGTAQVIRNLEGEASLGQTRPDVCAPQPWPDVDPAHLETLLAALAPLPEGQDVLDATLGGVSLTLPGEAEAGLLRLPEGRLEGGALALAVSAGALGSESFWEGARLAATALLKVAATGAEPRGLAIRAPLPGTPEGIHALEQALLGLRQAALALETCVADLRLEGEGPLELHVAALGTLPEAIPPASPGTAPRGLGGSGHHWATRTLRGPFDGLFHLGTPGQEALHLDEARGLAQVLQEGIRMGLLRAAGLPDREGPVATALAMARQGSMGLQLMLDPAPLGDLLYRPDPLTALVAVSPEGESSLVALAATHRVPCRKIGVVGGPRFSLTLGGQPLADLPMAPEPVSED